MKAKSLLKYIFFLFPLRRNKIIFDNYGGRGYGDDPKYICEQLLKSGERLDLVWLSKTNLAGLPSGVRAVQYGSMRAMYELATAGVLVDNIKSTNRPRKRRGQFYLQTWHSGLGLKKNETDAEEKLSPAYVKRAKRDAKETDLMYANNDFRLECYRNHYWYRGRIIKSSVPRCSVLFFGQKEAKTHLHQLLGIPEETGIVLYAPTFRENGGMGVYDFDRETCRKLLSEKRMENKRDFVVLMRLHPLIIEKSSGRTGRSGEIDVSGFPDFQELLAAADVLISDFSACVTDAFLVQKPVFLYAPDYEDYVTKDRGLYFSEEELPCRFCRDEEMLWREIRDFSKEEYGKRCMEFVERMGFSEDGRGDIFIAQLLLEQIKGKKHE